MSEQVSDASTPPKELSLADVIRTAQQLQRSERLDEAEAIYKAVLDALPDNPHALHFLGILRHQQSRNDEAIDLVRRAAALLPGDSGPWLNLGNILLEIQRFNEAVDAYQQAADYAPDNVLVYNNLGLLYMRGGRFDLAEPRFLHALKLAPTADLLLRNYSHMLQYAGRYNESIAFAIKTLDLSPNDPRARRLLGRSYSLLGDHAAAQKVLREWLAADPGNVEAEHLLAGAGGLATPARAPDAYIVAEFDGFAASFDAKLEGLGYRAPEYVADALTAAIAPATTAGDILDAGCGTGLCAERLLPMVTAGGRLDGVDLSAGMLDKARARGNYASLTQAELTAHIAAHQQHWNAIISADTLCYFGDLSAVFAASKTALRNGGWLIFSVEALDGIQPGEPGYRLNYSGRYTHDRDYLDHTLRAAGFMPLAIVQKVLRNEALQPVQGWVVTARNAA